MPNAYEVSNEADREMKRTLHKWIEDYWGERCADFEPECDCCKSWQAFDQLFQFVGDTRSAR